MKKRVISLLISVLMVIGIVGVMPAVAADKLISGDYKYEILDDGTARLLSYTGTDTNIVIPSEVDGIIVTEIGGALLYCDIASIEVAEDNQYFLSEDGILFSKDKSVLIKYPNISERTSYVIPNSVTEIYFAAFSESRYLEYIDIPDSVTKIGPRAFELCIKLRNIVIPDGVKKIEDGTFYNCRELSDIVLGNSVESIGAFAFDECPLACITMPPSVSSFHNLTFLYYVPYKIKCYSGSYAHQFAIDRGFNYELLDPELQGTVYYQTKVSESAVRFIAEVDIDDVVNADQSNVKIMFNGQETSVEVTKAYGSLIANDQKIEAQEGKCFIISPAVMTNNDGGDIISAEFTLGSCKGSIIREITV